MHAHGYFHDVIELTWPHQALQPISKPQHFQIRSLYLAPFNYFRVSNLKLKYVHLAHALVLLCPTLATMVFLMFSLFCLREAIPITTLRHPHKNAHKNTSQKGQSSALPHLGWHRYNTKPILHKRFSTSSMSCFSKSIEHSKPHLQFTVIIANSQPLG